VLRLKPRRKLLKPWSDRTGRRCPCRPCEGQVESPVHLAVGLLDDAAEMPGQGLVVGRVVRVGQAPEHVLALVGVREVEEEQPSSNRPSSYSSIGQASS